MNTKNDSLLAFVSMLHSFLVPTLRVGTHFPRRSASLIFAFLLAMLVLSADPCPAQTVPLTELVPLQDLEVRTTDLIRLAETFSDGLRDLRVAQLNLEALTSLSASTVVSQLEIRIAKLNVMNAERKLRIYRAIAEKELAAAKAKIEILEQMEKIGEKTDQPGTPPPPSQNRFRIAQARCVVAILQMIMEPIP